MKAADVILPATLVAAGLFAYHQISAGERVVGSSGHVHDVQPPDATPPVLRGAQPAAELAALGRRVAALERKVADLAERDAAATVASPLPRGGGGAGTPLPISAEALEATSPASLLDVRFGLQEIARFRALQEAARRQERLERVRDLAGRLLDQVPGGSLPEDERRRVLDESLRAWLRAREMGHLEPAAAQAASRALRADYHGAVERIVRGSRADVIVDRLAPLLGLTASAFRHEDTEER